jgi:hypothetical protein
MIGPAQKPANLAWTMTIGNQGKYFGIQKSFALAG